MLDTVDHRTAPRAGAKPDAHEGTTRHVGRGYRQRHERRRERGRNAARRQPVKRVDGGDRLKSLGDPAATEIRA
jgi:hypothetical protein